MVADELRDRDGAVPLARRSSRGCSARCRVPQLVVVDNGPDDGGAALAAEHGATVIERRDNPGLRRRLQPRAGARHRGRHGPAEPRHRAGRQRARQARPARPPGRAARAPAGRSRRDRPAQRASAPRHARGVHPRAAALGAPPRRAVPREAAAHRRLGGRRCLAARTDTFERSRFDPSIHLWAEDMDLCLRARAQGIRTICTPICASATPAATASTRSRSSSSRATAAT